MYIVVSINKLFWSVCFILWIVSEGCLWMAIFYVLNTKKRWILTWFNWAFLKIKYIFSTLTVIGPSKDHSFHLIQFTWIDGHCKTELTNWLRTSQCTFKPLYDFLWQPKFGKVSWFFYILVFFLWNTCI